MKQRSVMCWTLPITLVVFYGLPLTTVSFAAIPAPSSSHPAVKAFPEGERLVYSKLVEAFHHNDLATVVRERQILERNYPNSVHLDNAYYLNGMVELQHNRLGEAIKTFDVIKEHYVKSNKRPSALFAIGATYQRLNLPVQAHRVFSQVIKEYPGSPESQRAWMQLRVEKAVADKSLKR
jgi:TolA-binding protein